MQTGSCLLADTAHRRGPEAREQPHCSAACRHPQAPAGTQQHPALPWPAHSMHRHCMTPKCPMSEIYKLQLRLHAASLHAAGALVCEKKTPEVATSHLIRAATPAPAERGLECGHRNLQRIQIPPQRHRLQPSATKLGCTGAHNQSAAVPYTLDHPATARPHCR